MLSFNIFWNCSSVSPLGLFNCISFVTCLLSWIFGFISFVPTFITLLIAGFTTAIEICSSLFSSPFSYIFLYVILCVPFFPSSATAVSPFSNSSDCIYSVKYSNATSSCLNSSDVLCFEFWFMTLSMSTFSTSEYSISLFFCVSSALLLAA